MAREQNNHALAGGMGVGSDEDEAVDEAVGSLKKICGVGEESVVRLPLGSESNREMSESDVSLFETIDVIDGDEYEEDDDDEDNEDDGDLAQFSSRELIEELIERLRGAQEDDMDDWFSPSVMQAFSRLQKRLNELL